MKKNIVAVVGENMVVAYWWEQKLGKPNKSPQIVGQMPSKCWTNFPSGKYNANQKIYLDAFVTVVCITW